jgi:hypothetical protein
MMFDEDALRALVRDAIARQAASGEAPRPPAGGTAGDPRTILLHPSHFRYSLPESDGPCLIEPAVPCNHCGYCQSHGH